MLNMSSHQLRVFLVAAETLNFTQAAQILQMTQPSVSQHIQALEEHFGLSLFARSGRNIELTDAGMALVPLAREMVYLSIHIEETMASLQGNVHGHLVVGCSTSTGRYILPKLLASFHREYPQVRITCHVSTQLETMQMLMDGKIHLAVATNPSYCQDVEFCEFTREKIVLISPPGHPWASRLEIEPADLKDADFILPDEGSETHIAIREALAKVEFSVYQLKTLIALGSLEAIALSVAEGLGVGFVPLMVISRLVQDKVVQIKVEGLEIDRKVFIGRNTRRPGTAAQEAFWQFISDPENPVLKSMNNNKKQLITA